MFRCHAQSARILVRGQSCIDGGVQDCGISSIVCTYIYNTITIDIIYQTPLQSLKQNTNQSLKTPHTPQVSYEVYIG